MTKTLLIALGLLAAPLAATAAPLDSSDQGEYVLLDKDENPTPMQMQFVLKGKQWIMNGREGGGQWQPVCQGTGECRLQTSSAQKIHEWKTLLPSELRAMPMACIHNQAFAFCRMSKPDNPNMRLYWWFAWQNGRTYALGLNRLR